MDWAGFMVQGRWIFRQPVLAAGILLFIASMTCAQSGYRTRELVPLEKTKVSAERGEIPSELAGNDLSQREQFSPPLRNRRPGSANDAYLNTEPRSLPGGSPRGDIIPAYYPGDLREQGANVHASGAEPLSTTDNEALDRMKRAFGETDGNRIDLANTLQKIAWGTLTVLVVCGLMLFAMKKFGITAPGMPPSAASESNIRETIPLGPKCVAQLVQIQNHRILVVRDASGIKSVLHLPPSFEDELGHAGRNAA